MTPVLFSNDFLNQVTFDAKDIIDYNKTYHIIQQIDEGLAYIQKDAAAYAILRSAVEPYISEKFQTDILAVEADDLFTGTDYYAVYAKNLSRTGGIALKQLKDYCVQHFCQTPYFN